jgi:hypothetical protein
MKNFTLYITALLLVACVQTASDKDHIQGTWISDDDPQSSIVFEENVMRSSYGNTEQSSEVFEISDTLPGSNSAVQGPYIIVHSEDEPFTYAILELNKKELTLMFLPRGNKLMYSR